MRGADSSYVRLFADSRYQIQPTFPSLRRAASIADFHDAWVRPRPMAIIHEPAEREAGRGPSLGAGVRSCCVTRSPESQPAGLRTGFGGPTPPERSPASDVTRPGRTCGTLEWPRR